MELGRSDQFVKLTLEDTSGAISLGLKPLNLLASKREM